MLCKYKRDSCVQVKNKPCVECTVIMHLISWNRPRGSETILYSIQYTVFHGLPRACWRACWISWGVLQRVPWPPTISIIFSYLHELRWPHKGRNIGDAKLAHLHWTQMPSITAFLLHNILTAFRLNQKI
jgi:hypothetical protein